MHSLGVCENPHTKYSDVITTPGDLGRGTTDDSDLWHEYGSPAVATSARLKAEVEAGSVDAVYHIGDISYAVGYLASWEVPRRHRIPFLVPEP